ncbi:hypothetical protein KKA13_01965, partial [Patescibacteria group bacterium]|nr:hypothetical protein [Patescibacteria group bacterium]
MNLFRRNKSVSYVSQPIGGNRVQKKQFDARYLPNDYTRRNIVALFLLFVITCVWIWNVLYTPFFRINKVTYLGLSLIKRSEIDEFVQNEILNTKWKIPFNNYFLVNAKDAQQKLMSEFSLNSVEIKKIFPVEMRIDLEEKISTIIYDNGNKYYLLDTKGDVIKYLAATELPEKNLSNSSSDNIVATPTSTPVSDDNTSSTLLLDDKKTHIPEYRKLRKDYGQFPILYDMRNLFLNDDDENILTDNRKEKFLKVLENRTNHFT